MLNKLKKTLLTWLTSDATAVDGYDILKGVTAYSNGEKIVGKMEPLKYVDEYMEKKIAKLVKEEY